MLFTDCSNLDSCSVYLGCWHSDASGLWNCGNSAKYIYRPHKWKAGAPAYLQKMRTGCIFQQPVQLFFFLFLCTVAMSYPCDFS